MTSLIAKIAPKAVAKVGEEAAVELILKSATVAGATSVVIDKVVTKGGTALVGWGKKQINKFAQDHKAELEQKRAALQAQIKETEVTADPAEEEAVEEKPKTSKKKTK